MSDVAAELSSERADAPTAGERSTKHLDTVADMGTGVIGLILRNADDSEIAALVSVRANSHG